MTHTIPVPSFRRNNVCVFEKTREHTKETKRKVTKFHTTVNLTTIVVTEKFVKLSCGHEICARGLSKDITIKKSMNCYLCEREWMKANNCNYDGVVNE